MIPSLFVSYAIEQSKKAQRKIEFGKIAGIHPDRLKEIEERKQYLDNVILQYQYEREVN